jgi:tetratricopeptide (TPR) repeat protein
MVHRPITPFRNAFFLGLALFSAGCETTEQERLRHFNDDGVVRFRQGDFQGARDSFSEALTLKPEDANILYNIGQCYDRQGDWTKAEKYYRDCLAKSDSHEESRHALEVLLYRTGRKAEAARLIEDWLIRQPNLAGPYAEDGWRLRQENALPQAKARLQQALTIDHHHVRALTELGILYEQDNMPERALVLYERVLAQNPQQADIVERVNNLRLRNVRRPLPD